MRLQGLGGAKPLLVVAGAAHVDEIVRQLAGIGVAGRVLVEPEGRDSAPAVAAAAAWIASEDPDGVAVVVASDHHIPDGEAFRQAAATCALAAAEGAIVTFGVKPTAPATAYGYILPGEARGDSPVLAVSKFVEKPNAPTAERYVAEGYLWNSGNFVFRARDVLDELVVHAPGVAEATRAAVEQAGADGQVVRLGNAFRQAPKVSFDYAVMEKTQKAAVAPVAFDWSDLGAWDAVWAASPRDADGNAVSGQALLIDSRNSIVRADGLRGPVVGIGLDGLAVIAEPDGVMVCRLDASQLVKAALDALAKGAAAPPAPTFADLRDELDRWLRVDALPIWWTLGADHQGGGFHEALDAAARPVLRPRRARVQARQVYCYATAGALGWPGPWAAAVDHGLAYLESRYRLEDGLFRSAVQADGQPVDDTAMLYDQAFALLAFGAAAAALPDRAEALFAQAERVLTTLRRSRAHKGGFTEIGGITPFQANPHMHLLEAALALVEAGGGEVWRGLAGELIELAHRRFIDPATGGLREFFDEAWNPAPGPAGQLLDVGHQFEWAWLFGRWSRMEGCAESAAAVDRLLEHGRAGVDPVRGIATNVLSDDPDWRDPTARLWPQTERLKACLMFGDEAEAAAAARGLMRYFEVPTPGLWRDRMRADGGFVEEPAPASSFYHIVCAIAEVRRTAGGETAS